MTKLSIAHWNDAYNVTRQKVEPNGNNTIDVTKFGRLLEEVRRNWRPDDGLSFFSGDLFSPSVESTVTQGSHMVPVMNELAPDVAVAGNHDFDFGYPHLTELIKDSKYPWLLSNIVDQNTEKTPESFQTFKVLERSGIRVGVVGLVEQEWVNLVRAWPANFKYIDMAETGKDLSRKLRTEHQCDLVIALTHCRVKNDIQLAKDLLALSPSAQQNRSIAGEHGIDIIIGGHDHDYFISKGVTSWEEYDVSQPTLDVEGDNGDTLVVKSGTDFRDLSVFTLELEDTPSGSVRRKIIKAIRGKRHSIKPDMPSSENLEEIVKKVLSSLSKSMEEPVCISEVGLDVRSQTVRLGESVVGNWIADVLRPAYDDPLKKQYGSGSDGALLTGGTLRGDKLYSAGEITRRNILEILPFQGPLVAIEVSGQTLWDALEQGLSKYPEQEGRFPVVSGFRVSWDSRRPAGQRVLGIWLLQDSSGKVEELEVKKEKTGRTYKILMTDYVAEGHDGYTALKGQKYLVDEENGQTLSSLISNYLQGGTYIKTARLQGQNKNANDLSGTGLNVPFHVTQGSGPEVADLLYHLQLFVSFQTPNQATIHAMNDLLHGSKQFVVGLRSCIYYVGLSTRREYLNGGVKLRQGNTGNVKTDDEKPSKEDPGLLIIHPMIDGRLKDEARN